ncbi:MAG: hypothetical protein ACRD1S_03695 [Vicinamibacterales bacterium]
MVRRLSIALLLSLWAAPAFAQTSLLPTLVRIRSEYPTPWSSLAQIGEYLNRVAWEHRAEGWGLLRKTGGTRCPAPQGVEIACDILIHQPTQLHFDVLIDSTGVGTPTWREVGPCDPMISGCEMSRFLLPIAVLGKPKGLRVVQ